MWYLLWILGLILAVWLSIVGALRLEAQDEGKER
ncbi:MAG: CydX/CbdX family cytochrome bd oxidase small subunit [Candidatus Accumulibacter sp.]|nr:CydX/CbdX family cytochrome bd oxidase small subunit [Accumulibacter sp.]